MVSKVVRPGSLVRLTPGAHQAWFYTGLGADAVGLVVQGPEPFGFVDRCYVLWKEPGEEPEHWWSDLEDLEVINESR